jgi:hypothetical protein
VPISPRLNRKKAAGPAIGFSASAACSAVWISVLPAACRVTAVVRMLKKATRLELALRLLGPADQGTGVVIGPLFFDFLRTLPEEEIGADGGAEDRHDQGERVARELELRQQRANRDRVPVDLHREDHADIGKEGEGQPFQEADVTIAKPAV